MHSTRRLHALAAVIALGSLAACGSDDDDSAATTSAPVATTAAPTTAAPTTTAADGDLETFCAKSFEIETVDEPDLDFDAMTEEELAEAAKTYAATVLQPLAQEVVASAPAAIAADIAVQAGAVDQLAQTGDFGVFEDPAVDVASDNTHRFTVENCGWADVQVVAQDYSFGGIPATVPAGIVGIELTNASEKELHEIVVLKRNPGTTETVEELFALPEEEGRTKVSDVGATFAEPGASDSFVAELGAGDYIAVCFIPVGATPENEEGTGPPHFTQGMTAEFTVEA